jgi:hypothetical protein
MNATTATDDHSLSSSPVSRPQGGGTDAALHLLCAYLSIALLLGLGANALARWWWADPLTALVIATVAAGNLCQPSSARRAGPRRCFVFSRPA